MKPAISLGLAIAVTATIALAQQPASPPAKNNAQERVTDQIALELGRLRIENATLNVSVEVLRGAIADLQRRLKDCAPAEGGTPK